MCMTLIIGPPRGCLQDHRSYRVPPLVSTRSTLRKNACTHPAGSRAAAHALIFSCLLLSCLLVLSACASTARIADARLKAIYTAEWKWREEQFPDDEDPKSRSRITCRRSIRPARHAPREVAGYARAARRHPARRPLADGAAQLCGLPAADRDADRQSAIRDFEMPANSDTTFWTDLGYTARRPYPKPAGLP